MSPQKRFPWKLFSRVVAVQAILVLAALAASGLAARYFFKQHFLAQVENQLMISLGSLAPDLPASPGQGWCGAHSPDPAFRLTVIALDGTVVCDSHHDTETMENHLNRPEVQEALRSGVGQGVRFSITMSEKMLYGALPTKKFILRGSIPLANLIATLNVFDTSLTLFLVFIALTLGGLAAWSGRKLAFPIGRLLLKAQGISSDASGTYDELSDLETSLDDIRRDLDAKAESLSREREEQATLMSAISDAILAVDVDGAPLFYNSRFAVLFGGRESLRDGKTHLWEIFRDPEVLGAFKRALKEGVPGSVNAVELDYEAGKKFFSLSVAPLRRTSAGAIYGAVGVFHDVTELKRTEQIRIDFVANVSHELRTPLTAIKGYTDTLAQDIDAARPITKDFVDVISRNTERLMSLINDLLDLSSLESNADDLHRSRVSTAEISERVVNQLQGSFQAKGQAVEVRADAPVVYADARRLEQVLVNLLDNASKYTPAGGKIRVLWERNGAADTVVMKVSDSGPGIPPEHHARLFERFYRVDKARSRELGGTGLGLAIVKHIMQRHAGAVWVESTAGHGSTFICKFPGGGVET
jgi:two-component system phosphate regulon sensor histidine kinase PhoR